MFKKNKLTKVILAGLLAVGSLTANVASAQAETAFQVRNNIGSEVSNISNQLPIQELAYGSGATLTMKAVFYSEVGGCTALGERLYSNSKVIAVDPRVIKLGSYVYVEVVGCPELNGTYKASDTGGAIKGNIIDIHLPNASMCSRYGVRTCRVTVL